jgi:hypothetical protein
LNVLRVRVADDQLAAPPSPSAATALAITADDLVLIAISAAQVGTIAAAISATTSISAGRVAVSSDLTLVPGLIVVITSDVTATAAISARRVANLTLVAGLVTVIYELIPSTTTSAAEITSRGPGWVVL